MVLFSTYLKRFLIFSVYRHHDSVLLSDPRRTDGRFWQGLRGFSTVQTVLQHHSPALYRTLPRLPAASNAALCRAMLNALYKVHVYHVGKSCVPRENIPQFGYLRYSHVLHIVPLYLNVRGRSSRLHEIIVFALRLNHLNFLLFEHFRSFATLEMKLKIIKLQTMS